MKLKKKHLGALTAVAVAAAAVAGTQLADGDPGVGDGAAVRETSGVLQSRFLTRVVRCLSGGRCSRLNAELFQFWRGLGSDHVVPWVKT